MGRHCRGDELAGAGAEYARRAVPTRPRRPKQPLLAEGTAYLRHRAVISAHERAVERAVYAAHKALARSAGKSRLASRSARLCGLSLTVAEARSSVGPVKLQRFCYGRFTTVEGKIVDVHKTNAATEKRASYLVVIKNSARPSAPLIAAPLEHFWRPRIVAPTTLPMARAKKPARSGAGKSLPMARAKNPARSGAGKSLPMARAKKAAGSGAGKPLPMTRAKKAAAARKRANSEPRHGPKRAGKQP
jgi:hypothetical protein